MLTLEHDIPHDVEGIVDRALLLNIAWPDPAYLRYELKNVQNVQEWR
jgi:hypothetical protein